MVSFGVVLVPMLVLVSGWLVLWLVRGRLEVLVLVASASVLEVERGVVRRWGKMVSRIQSLNLVIRAYTPGFLACAQPTPQLTSPAK